MDYDYVDKLSSEEKQWLANFTDEYYNASVGSQKDEGQNNHFHKSKELVKERQDANNKVNNDVYGKARSKRNILGMDYNTMSEYLDRRVNKTINDTEDAIVEILDKRKNLENTNNDTNGKREESDQFQSTI